MVQPNRCLSRRQGLLFGNLSMNFSRNTCGPVLCWKGQGMWVWLQQLITLYIRVPFMSKTWLFEFSTPSFPLVRHVKTTLAGKLKPLLAMSGSSDQRYGMAWISIGTLTQCTAAVLHCSGSFVGCHEKSFELDAAEIFGIFNMHVANSFAVDEDLYKVVRYWTTLQNQW